MTRLNSNQVIALLLAVVSVGYLAMAWQIPAFPLPRPIDSDLFPKVLGFMLLGLSVLLFLEKPQAQDVPEELDPEEQQLPLLLRPWTRVVITALALAAYALLLVPVGFVLTSVALVFGLAAYYGYRRHWINFATALGVVLGLYLTMTRIMGVYLPTGVLPI
ncbi:tripartite tricarboxylate transporter TctB family protein [Billgrantia kenyensis]|uniref:Tripartite tricarboxylate transporter TctB family protein n=1 Tax=Billgrantia kenyensis TaxID=321266 RepID=A0A7W0ACM1_9GAMM|nr:tripartite tricarboxylate transporter TctB family protein [Halomonas kenyensis]MBA2777699.1 tripartite tricarboxylate transporter TctB family protein [Halomonas kenyensis]MCG6660369.1 tripartite tricarboxylate transporter TctB family protein [Halomonas kenyensis]